MGVVKQQIIRKPKNDLNPKESFCLTTESVVLHSNESSQTTFNKNCSVLKCGFSLDVYLTNFVKKKCVSLLKERL